MQLIQTNGLVLITQLKVSCSEFGDLDSIPDEC